MDALGERLYAVHAGKPARIVGREYLSDLLRAAALATGLTGFNQRFLIAEWDAVVDAWQLTNWDEYRDVRRLGRKTRLPEKRRAELWAVFTQVREGLARDGFTTHAALFTELAALIARRKHPLFDFTVLDEAQDVSVAQLRFLAALGGERPNCLFFAGDLGQRIFQQPFSWKSLGVDIRGRARTLHINYRTSHQIRAQADLLLGPDVQDVDGNIEERRGTVSIFNGPAPEIHECDSPDAEIELVSTWLVTRHADGLALAEIGVFVRSEEELPRAIAALDEAGLAYDVIDERTDTASENVSLCTMHLAKGLEFRAVAVMACDDEVIPSQARIQAIGDQADLQEIYDTERHLLYVACTRARDRLLISSGRTASEFLQDLRI
jgi:superfamily I DNA/RNA helicase